ncbi:adhesin [Nitratidesulfovibrio liaohensis]|uniref:Adhesin n=1 Tax=Nitratidesulfovibrio liaohensis TaxID=2604158 RepID=A0ABY9R4M5_9BACT|nr:adhesin [Nitratidesulfovibrio liaohensis]WMW65684.1 adhesin [Nitratidesulfovibrio liaohensis]
MITLEHDARGILEEYFSENPQSPIRIYVSPRGSRGPHLVLGPDAPTPRDHVVQVDGYTFCISQRLAQQVGAVRIRARNAGFEVVSERPLSARTSDAS